MRSALITSAVLLLGVLIRVQTLSRPIAELSPQFLVDDSFICLDVARSVINLDGVTNAAAFDAIRAGRIISYALAQGVSYFLGPAANIRFLWDRETDPQLKSRLQFHGVRRGPEDGILDGNWFAVVP